MMHFACSEHAATDTNDSSSNILLVNICNKCENHVKTNVTVCHQPFDETFDTVIPFRITHKMNIFACRYKTKAKYDKILS